MKFMPVKRPVVEGISLRQYFAGQALIGMLANSNASDKSLFTDFASDAVAQADALIAELSKPNDRS